MASSAAPIRRRSSVTNTQADVNDAIDEAFLCLGKSKDGVLTACQVEKVLKNLLSLKDPRNDADSICAAIDANEDGHIDPHEFHVYISPTVVAYAAAGKPLDVEDVLRDAFRETIDKDTRVRDKIIQAFMLGTTDFESSTRKKGGWALPVNKGWMHGLFKDTYEDPTDPAAPRYKHNRMPYLFKRLAELQVTPKDPKSQQARAKEEYRRGLGCPKEEDLVAFCGIWLKRLQEAGLEASSECSSG